jgi:hypothetical protein
MEKIKTLEEKEQLFSINPDRFYGSQMNKYPVLLRLLKLRDNPTLSQTMSFKIQEIIRDDLNEAENLKIQVVLMNDDALESRHILLNNAFVVLKKGLNFIQKVGGKVILSLNYIYHAVDFTGYYLCTKFVVVTEI